jgi:isocitrate/isopropylmalate dehydrogenase
MKVVALGGDGTGPEVLAEALKVLSVVEQSIGIKFEVDHIPCGGQYYLEHGRDWPEGSLERCKAADLILLGAVGWPDPNGNGPVMMQNGKMAGWSPVIGNRIELDLFANVRPVKLYPGVSHRIHGKPKQVWQPELVDMVMIRENTEGLYSGMGGILAPGGHPKVAIDTRVITYDGCHRVILKAFELCRQRGKGAPKDGKLRVTGIVKDNVLKGCKLFTEVFFEIAKDFPEIEAETAIVDAFTQWLIGQPEHYDVCVTTNMFGDIITDLASVLQGGMGMAVGCNVGKDHAMFEPIHGSAPKHAGQDKVNPLAMIMALKEGLDWLAHRPKTSATQTVQLVHAAKAIETAVVELLAEGHPLTYDLVGAEKASKMSEVGSAVAAKVEASLKAAVTA